MQQKCSWEKYLLPIAATLGNLERNPEFNTQYNIQYDI